MNNDALTILMILTSHASLGGGKPTGVWFEELTTPYYVFVDAGFTVDIASIAGDRVPIDPNSLHPSQHNPPSVERFLLDEAAMEKITRSASLAGLSADSYAAVFLPGGHGTMWDLPDNPTLAAQLGEAWTAGKVVAAVCHGPAGLLGATDGASRPLVDGRRVSAFSNAEEKAVGLTQTVPFLLEDRLRALGARYEAGPDFLSHAVRDGRLVTGQNPASSEAVARLVVEAVRETAPARP